VLHSEATAHSQGPIKSSGRKALKVLLIAGAALSFLAPGLRAEDLQVVPSPHKWGAEIDLGWSPGALWPGRETRLWLGLEGSYKSWQYFRDPSSGRALSSADSGDAAASEAIGLWFLGLEQGLLPQPTELGPGARPWDDPDLLEAFAYYRGIKFSTLSSGSYLADSSLPERDGYLETAFLGGLSLDRVTEVDSHDLKEGYLLEASGTLAPRSLQSVDASYRRATFIAQGFLPLWDSAPESRLNRLSLLAGVNAAVDRLWGESVPAQERQVIGGRAWDGVGGFVEGLGGAVRGAEDGRFDADLKAVANLELRLNLPGFEVGSPVEVPLFDKPFSCVPGILAYVDAGAWNGLPGDESGALLSVGLGAYMTVLKYGSLSIYNDYWLAGGSPYESGSFRWHMELGMHF